MAYEGIVALGANLPFACATAVLELIGLVKNRSHPLLDFRYHSD